MPNKSDFPEHCINRTPATIQAAFDAAAEGIVENGNLGHINLSSIYTKIIQDAGRFCENYASDILYGIDRIKALCENIYATNGPISEIISFGLRENGSDHNEYIMSQLHNSRRGLYPYVHAKPHYRRILAVKIDISDDPPEYYGETPKVRCELRDITNHFLYLNDADLGEDGKIIQTPYPNGNPKPADMRCKSKEQETKND